MLFLHSLSKSGFLVAFLMCVCLHERVGAVVDSDALRSLALADEDHDALRNSSTSSSSGGVDNIGNITSDEEAVPDIPQALFWTPSAAPEEGDDGVASTPPPLVVSSPATTA